MLAQLHGQQRDPASEEHPLPDHEQHKECVPASAEHPLADHEQDEQGGELPLPDYEQSEQCGGSSREHDGKQCEYASPVPVHDPTDLHSSEVHSHSVY